MKPGGSRGRQRRGYHPCLKVERFPEAAWAAVRAHRRWWSSKPGRLRTEVMPGCLGAEGQGRHNEAQGFARVGPVQTCPAEQVVYLSAAPQQGSGGVRLWESSARESSAGEKFGASDIPNPPSPERGRCCTVQIKLNRDCKKKTGGLIYW